MSLPDDEVEPSVLSKTDVDPCNVNIIPKAELSRKVPIPATVSDSLVENYNPCGEGFDHHKDRHGNAVSYIEIAESSSALGWQNERPGGNDNWQPKGNTFRIEPPPEVHFVHTRRQQARVDANEAYLEEEDQKIVAMPHPATVQIDCSIVEEFEAIAEINNTDMRRLLSTFEHAVDHAEIKRYIEQARREDDAAGDTSEQPSTSFADDDEYAASTDLQPSHRHSEASLLRQS